jgi:multiple sugar transport system ATP-binding protein
VASVRLDNVKKVFEGGVVAVHEINLSVADKEFVVLVGPSGCGKTTTLRMIAGLEEVSQGEIYIGDRLVNDVPPKDRDIAMVFQNYALYPHMSVFDNMAFGLKLRHFPKKEIHDRVREAAAILGIEELLDRKPKALSGGQRQRVAVGRAIVRKPQVFLFDEPLSNLDAKFRVQMRTEISKLHQRLATTMIYVTHDQTEAMTMGDRIVVMKDGIVQQIDTPLELYNHPVNRFVAGFIGSPAMNFIPGTIRQNRGLVFWDEQKHWALPLPPGISRTMRAYAGKPVVLGLRPEHIALNRTGRGRTVGCRVKASVEVVEPMGNEVYLYFNPPKGGPQYVARLVVDQEPPVGKLVELSFDMTRAHFFDPATGSTING